MGEPVIVTFVPGQAAVSVAADDAFGSVFAYECTSVAGWAGFADALEVFVVSGGLFCPAAERSGFVVDVGGHDGGVPVEVVEDVLGELCGVVRGWDAVPVVPEGSDAPGGVSVAFSGLKEPLEDFVGEVPAW
jgi:hypothetical protein